MMAYIELIRPEVVLVLGILAVGFAALGAYAIHVDKKREEQGKHHKHSH